MLKYKIGDRVYFSLSNKLQAIPAIIVSDAVNNYAYQYRICRKGFGKNDTCLAREDELVFLPVEDGPVIYAI